MKKAKDNPVFVSAIMTVGVLLFVLFVTVQASCGTISKPRVKGAGDTTTSACTWPDEDIARAISEAVDSFTPKIERADLGRIHIVCTQMHNRNGAQLDRVTIKVSPSDYRDGTPFSACTSSIIHEIFHMAGEIVLGDPDATHADPPGWWSARTNVVIDEAKARCEASRRSPFSSSPLRRNSLARTRSSSRMP